jgi:hypothetical protein
MSVFDDFGVAGKLVIPSFLKFRTYEKPSLGSRDTVPRTGAAGVFFLAGRLFFQSRFRPEENIAIRELHVVSECVLFLKVSNLRIKSQRVGKNLSAKATSPGENCGIFSIVSFLPSVFAHMVDVTPDLGFWRSWCRWKACDTFFLKVLGLQESELGFERYGPVNRGCRSVSP